MDATAEIIDPLKRLLRRHSCRCEKCRQNQAIRGILRRGDKKEMRDCIRGLSEMLCNNEEELGMAHAYIDDLKAKAVRP